MDVPLFPPFLGVVVSNRAISTTLGAPLAPRKFKRGPVSIAKRAKVPIVPLTILGTGRLMPAKKEYLPLGAGGVGGFWGRWEEPTIFG